MVVRARTYLCGIAQRIHFYAAAEIFVSPAAQGTFDPYRIAHYWSCFIRRCNYLVPMIDRPYRFPMSLPEVLETPMRGVIAQSARRCSQIRLTQHRGGTR